MMIAESIKKILGDELAKQVETALQGKGKDGKDVDIVVGNDGTYVPAEKYEAVKKQSASAENALKNAAAALKAVGGSGDPAKIADDVQAAQQTIDNLQKQHKQEMTKLQKQTALRMALASTAHDPSDIISLLDMDKIDVDDNGNLKTDIDSLIQPIRESKPYLFKQQENGVDNTLNIKGAAPADVKNSNTSAGESASGPVSF